MTAGQIHLVGFTVAADGTAVMSLDGSSVGGTSSPIKDPGTPGATALGLLLSSGAYFGGSLFYALHVAAARDADAEAWLSANFPIGEPV